MKSFKSAKGIGAYYIFGVLVLCDALIIALLFLINSYIMATILKAFFVACTLYQLYYVLLSATVVFNASGDAIEITEAFGLRKILIPLGEIKGYSKSKGKINGVKLSGFGKNTFALGKAVIHKYGTCNMFVTSSKEVIYLNTDKINYAISPENITEFELFLNTNGISLMEWEHKQTKVGNLYKEKRFLIPFIIVSVIIVFITLNPFILYLTKRLPDYMPLNFDAAFKEVQRGTGKEFAFGQMVYGALNMAILFCMYYASYFYAKYDKKSANKFIYVAMVIAITFMLIQIRILLVFR